MTLITQILVVLTAILFLFIMFLETIATTSPRTAKVFDMTQEQLKQKQLNTLMKNQGVYNGLIGIMLLYNTFFSPQNTELTTVLLSFCFLVAIYGTVTSNKNILFKQGLLPFIALLSIYFLN